MSTLPELRQTTFNNQGSVGLQVGQQHNYGTVNNYQYVSYIGLYPSNANGLELQDQTR